MNTHMQHRRPAGLSPEQSGFGWRFRRRWTPNVRHVARYERVLGTSCELQISALTQEAGLAAEAAVLQEIDRLEGIFSAYHADSELCRWQETYDKRVPVSPELAAVLRDAEDWRQRTDGAFHPAAEALTRLWRAGAERGAAPCPEVLGQLVAELAEPLWDVDQERLTARRRTRLPVTLNAVAKGFIIDSACRTAMQQPGVCAALVNIGGDIRHAGAKPVSVAVTDPFASQDNAAPLAVVRFADRGIATSGNYRRGFHIGGRWYSHLLDPRTGRPTDEVVSASVVADCAQRADVLTTAFSVMRPEESLRLADGLPRIGVLIVTRDGKRCSNKLWRQYSR